MRLHDSIDKRLVDAGVASRRALLRGMITDPTGWPQYLPRRAGDEPGLCGTSYAVLALARIDEVLGSASLVPDQQNRLLKTILSKRSDGGGFVVDAHRPIPTFDACWESVLVMMTLGHHQNWAWLRRTVKHVLEGQRASGAWPVATTVDADSVFATIQMVELLTVVTRERGSQLAPELDLIATAVDRGVIYLLESVTNSGTWHLTVEGPPSIAITSRAILCLRFAGRLEPGLGAAAAEWLLAQRLDCATDEWESWDLQQYDPASHGRERIYRYSHSSRALAVLALCEIAKRELSEAFPDLASQMLEDQRDGLWSDSFVRHDSADGRVLWYRSDYQTPRYQPLKGRERFAVWPVMFNFYALSALLAPSRFRAGPLQIPVRS